MVRVCAFPGCFNQEKSVRLRQCTSIQEESLTFHTLPLHDPERLKLWLLALRRDTGSSIQSVRGLRVCSEHFLPDDFSAAERNRRRLLKPTAVPVWGPQHTEVCLEIKIYRTDQTDFSCPLARTQAKKMEIPSSLSDTVEKDEPAQIEVLADKKDLRFFHPSSISNPVTEEGEEKDVHWKERTWLVNESSLMKLFRICQKCGGPVLEAKTTNSGSFIHVQWECSKGHKGQWSSCSDVQSMPES